MSPVPNEKEGFINRLTEITEANMTNEQFGVNELAREMGMSRSNLHRKVKSLTGGSVSKFICRVRLEGAKELLQDSSSTISEIAFDTGFHSVTYFTKCFKDHFGYTPGESRKHIQAKGNPDGHEQQEEHTGIVNKKIPLIYFLISTFVLIVIIIIFTVWKPFGEGKEPLEKSIAVLPFINDSPEETEMYFINGTMEAILNNLCKIEDLRVVSRNSVEQYRNNPKATIVVAEEMNVSYILEGSGMRHEDQLFVTVQLIDARSDKHIWSESYQKGIGRITELFSEVALSIVAEINVHISPEEKSLIEKIPTTSRAAYELYLRAMDGLEFYSSRRKLEQSIDLLRQSIEYDPGFADAYAEIGWIFDALYYSYPFDYPGYLDSVLLYANKALALDEQVYMAHEIKAVYYNRMGDMTRTLEHFKEALRINPNALIVYESLGWVYFSQNDFVPSIETFYKATLLERGERSIEVYYGLGLAYNAAGFHEKSKELLEEKLASDGDSVSFYYDYASAENFAGNPSGALEAAKKAVEYSNGNWICLEQLMVAHFGLGQFGEATEYCNRFLDIMETIDRYRPYNMTTIIYLLRQSGDSARADHYLEKLIEYNKYEVVTQGSLNSLVNNAQISALLGENEKALEYLAQIARQERLYVWVNKWRTSPVFSEISTEPEFLRVISEIERKFELQREQDRRQLEEMGLL